MSASSTPDWVALQRSLRQARAAARAERRLHGRVLPQTLMRLDEELARAQTALAIDDARKAAGRTDRNAA
jgi:hypothetical protein